MKSNKTKLRKRRVAVRSSALVRALAAAEEMDWMQVVLNQGPPCFHLCDDGRFCGRSKRWEGHDKYDESSLCLHEYVSLKQLLESIAP